MDDRESHRAGGGAHRAGGDRAQREGAAGSFGKRAERWQRIARESSQQSRRLRAPAVLPAVRFEEALATVADYRYFLDEPARPRCHGMSARRPDEAGRGGSADRPGGRLDGCRTAAAATAGWRVAGARAAILRAETAAMAALAVLLAAWTA